jgi:hypothetical protein
MLNKYILLPIAIFTGFNTVLANEYSRPDSTKKITIEISIGASIPMGAFGSKGTDTTSAERKDTNRIYNGYAKTGFHFDVTGGYFLGNNFRFMILLGGNMNTVDAKTYTTVNGIKSPESLTATSYYVGQYFMGLSFSLPGDKLSVSFSLLGGLVTASYLTTTRIYPLGPSTETEVSTGNGGIGFGYQFGAGIKYSLNNCIGLTFNVAYTGSSITYIGNTYTDSGVIAYTTANPGHKQIMMLGLLTTSVGIEFDL